MSNLMEELEDLSPWLKDQKKRGDGMDLPEGYFGDFEQRMMERLAETPRAQKPSFEVKAANKHRWRIPRPYLAAAASVALLVAAWWFMRPTPASMPISTDLSAEDVQAYLLDNIHEFEVDQLASLETESSHLPEAGAVAPPLPPQETSDELHPEDLDVLLRDLSEEELEEIL